MWKKYLLIAFCLLSFLYVNLLGYELLLKIQYNKEVEKTAVLEAKNPYNVFRKKFIHPIYFYFLPWKQEDIEEANSDTVSVTKLGFRGPDPEAKGGRKLAFLVGGSTAFGFGVTSNDQTITAHLNNLQGEYFFVNAGVPSWNSMQELHRFMHQLVLFRPSLVVLLNGYNNVKSSFIRIGTDTPNYAVESYEYIEKWVNDILSRKVSSEVCQEVPTNFSTWDHLALLGLRMKIKGEEFRSERIQLSRRIGDAFLDQMAPASERLIDTYSHHIDLFQKIGSSFGVEVRVFLQPYWRPESESSRSELESKFDSFLRGFYTKVSRSLGESHNVKSLMSAVPRRSEDGIPYFLDAVHLSDHGSKELAKVLWEEIQK